MAGKKSLDQRQIDFLRFYNDPLSETFGNGYQSAIRAKYSEEYAKVIASRATDWLSEDVKRRTRMLAKAERNLESVLDEDVMEPIIGMFGMVVDKKTNKPYYRRNTKVMALKQDTSKFIAETVGKKHYSKRTELTGPDAAPLLNETEKKKIDEVINKNIHAKGRVRSA